MAHPILNAHRRGPFGLGSGVLLVLATVFFTVFTVSALNRSLGRLLSVTNAAPEAAVSAESAQVVLASPLGTSAEAQALLRSTPPRPES